MNSTADRDPEQGRWQGRWSGVKGRLPGSLLSHAPDEAEPSAQSRRRRRMVVTAVGMTGAGLLARGLSTPPGSTRFYLTTLGVAATWSAGAVMSGPLRVGWVPLRDNSKRRPVVVPILTGCAAFGFFFGCALVVRRIPIMNRAITGVLKFADQGNTPLVVLTTCANAVGEELFFRGALYDAIGGQRRVATTTAAYTAATAVAGNPALTVAATVMGTLFGLQRRASGGVQAPILTHLTWSMLMLKYLTPLFHPNHTVHPGHTVHPNHTVHPDYRFRPAHSGPRLPKVFKAGFRKGTRRS